MTHPIMSKLLYAGGLIATAASIKGSYVYIFNETGNDIIMAGSAALGLGAIAYVGWEVAFNHKGIAKRAAALTIALAAACTSTYTIYQGSLVPALQAAQLELDAKTQATENQKQFTYQAQLKNYELQQNNLQASIADLKSTNALDTEELTKLTAEEAKKTSRAADKLRATIDARNTKVIELTEKLASLSIPELKPPAPTPKAEAPTINWPLLARSGLYEAMVALALLFGAWFKTARQESESQLVTQLKQVTEQAQLQAIVAADKHAELVLALSTAQDLQAELKQQVASINQQSSERLTALATNLTQTAQALKIAKGANDQLSATSNQAQALAKQLEHASKLAQADLHAVTTSTSELTQLQNQLQSVTQTANATLANASNLFAPANRTTNAPTNTPANAAKQKMTIEQVVTLLSQSLINPNADDLITTESIMESTGLGRTLAEKALTEAHNQGILERLPRGRGFSHRYAKHDTSNVLPLRRA